MNIKIVILTFLLGICWTIQIQAATEDKVLNNIIKNVLLHNKELKAAFHEWKAALEVPAQAGSLPDPILSFTHFIEEVETRVGPQQRAIALKQKFPWFGKLRLKSELAEKMAVIKETQYLNIKNKLVYSTKNTYYDLYFINRSIQITKEHLHLLQTIEKNLQSNLKVAKSSFADLLKVQTELDRLRDKERSLQERLLPILNKLGSLSGQNKPLDIPLPKNIDAPAITQNFQILQKQLNHSNLEYQVLNIMQEKEKVSTKLAQKNLWPNFSIGLKQVFTDDALNPNMVDSGKDPIMLSVGLSLPIWRDKIKSNIRESIQKEKAIVNKKSNRMNWLSTELQMAYFQYQDSDSTLRLYLEKLIPKTKQTLEVIRKLYEGGKKGFISMIDTERVLLHYEIAYEKALRDKAHAAAKIEYLVEPIHNYDRK